MRRPSFQFYPADWRNNANLGRCSPAARGIWVDIMCVLHDSDEYGVVRWPLLDLANAAHAPIKLVRELVEKNVLKGDDKAVDRAFVYVPRSGRKNGDPVTLIPTQAGPVWFSSRMVKDEYVRANAGATTRFTSEDTPPRKSAEGTERAKLRARVLEKAGGHCFHCKTELGEVWEIDHFIPRAKGGRHIFSNLVASCRDCNQDKSDTLPDDWEAPSRSPSHREGEGKGDGSTYSSSSTPTVNSVPIGTGGAAADGKRDKTPAERRKSELWRGMKEFLVDSGESKDLKAAGAVITKAIQRFDEATALAGIEATLHARPAAAIAYLEGACQQATGARQNKQEALESGNLAAAERFALEPDHVAH